MYEKQVSKVLNYKKKIVHNQTSASSDESSKLSCPDRKNIINKLYQKQTRLPSQDIQDIIKQYLDGLNINELAKKYQCHRTTISQHLKNHDVNIRDLSIPDHLIDKAAQLHESGLSYSKIGAQLGFDGETIRKKLKKRGI